MRKLYLSIVLLVGGWTFADQPVVAPSQNLVEDALVEVDQGRSGVTAETLANGDLALTFADGLKGYPGVNVKPKAGVWNLSAFGHVACRVTNTGDKPFGMNVRVDQDNDGKYVPDSWNTESCWVKPGESQNVTVIFGHQYGHKPGYPLKSEKVAKVLLFASSVPKGGISCRIEGLRAAGPAGEKPAVKPPPPCRKPKNGILFDTPRRADKQNGIRTQTPWDLSDHWSVALTLRNAGKKTVTAKARLKSRNYAGTKYVSVDLAPDEVKTVRLPFLPETHWVGPSNVNGGKGTGGSEFDSLFATAIELIGEDVEALKAVVGDTPMKVPEWVGKRPPVKGEWVKTLDENFDTLNPQVWNVKSPNYWDKRSHFSRDNVIVKDGVAVMRYEKKRGWHNDEPGHKFGETDYQTGFLSTYGKWTQRYGYIEARMKLPQAPGLWPAFWLMPDRGKQVDPTGKEFWWRDSTDKLKWDQVGGMEFDIMEHLTVWGPNRFNVAWHWNGYQNNHKTTGSQSIYLGPDKDGFITVGLLWEPGHAAIYGNGLLLADWTNERIADTQEYILFDFVSGGWANNAIDDAKLPADFVIDYVRAWQRTDLASPEDGMKANDGRDLQPIAQ